MQTTARVPFSSLKTEGGLLPAELLQQLADGRQLVGLQPESYHLLPGERLNEAVNRAWNRCRSAWQHFDQARRTLPPEASGTTLTRERWLLVLFQELGYGRLQLQREGLPSDDGTPYPISHLWEETPIHLLSFRQGLDRRADSTPGFRRSPHSLLQELLNRSQRYRWGLLSNGLQLRLLHDNVSLKRAAYLEFDLESILAGDLYAEFSLVWLLCHQSRIERLEDNTCWLERWSTLSIEQGTRAMDALREGVAEALQSLGSGFLAANRALRTRLQNGDLSLQAYYQQLRRLVYRLIFLFVAEDRALLLLPTATPAEQLRYSRYYSLRRLRTLAEELRGDSHTDLYRQVRLLFTLLRTGYAGLGLPALGSFLFSERSTPDLDSLELSNQTLLAALRALTLTIEQNVRRRVDYRNLDSEELGSVYESLLELLPALERGSFVLRMGAGSERKTTGSHYTPRPLVECLLDSALEPVVAERLADAERLWRQGSRQGTQRTQQEAALLSIKVCDGAMGSGHLLIGAGRRLAKHLAHLRTGEEEPTPADLRAAMRDVVRHCLYGVDTNDMAVELCKVALWMETMEPGRPLSFLDAHIQCGNSLVGVTPALNIDEIPDDAFQPVSGDDKTTALGLRRRNKKEREGQLALLFAQESATEQYAAQRARQMAALTDQPEDAVAQVAEKEDAYAHYLRSHEYQQARCEADTWTAAFFWPIPPGDPASMNAPTQQVLRSVRAGSLEEHAPLLKKVQRIATQQQFFHWPLHFPEVFQRKNPGFDLLLMNPPWERIKLQEKEWFAAHSPEIAQAPNAAARKRRIAALEKNDPLLWQAFQETVRTAENSSHFIRSSGKYPLCGRGDVNTYAIFAELVRQIQAQNGRIGIILPSGIATDDTTKYYFQQLSERSALVSLYDFENRRAIFPDVHRSFKFCLLTLRGEQGPVQAPAEFVFFAHAVEDLQETERRFTLTAAEIALLNPNTRTCPTFRSRRDAELTKSIYRRVPVLIREETPEQNPWKIRFSTMFHMSNDSHLFRTHIQLEQDGWQLDGNQFILGSDVMLPLYEAKMFHHFDHRWATYEGGETQDVTSAEKKNEQCVVLPRYWVAEQEVQKRIDPKTRWLLAFRDICRSTDERTAIFTAIPAVAVGHTAPLLCLSERLETAAGLMACLSSFVFDYTVRQFVGGTHLTYSYLKQLPVLPPEAYAGPCPWDRGCTVAGWLQLRVLELTYTAWDLQPFAQDCGYDGPPFRWEEARRFLLRCELDAAHFHLYGIEREDVAYILDTFPIVARKESAIYGEYRTRRVVLEIYDALAAAMRTGEPYTSQLEPPPAAA